MSAVKGVCLEGSVRLTLNDDYFAGNEALLALHGGRKYLGLAQVCYMNNYHSVCYTDQQSFASVICKQLGFSPNGIYHPKQY